MYGGGGCLVASGVTTNNIQLTVYNGANADNYVRARINDIIVSNGSVF